MVVVKVYGSAMATFSACVIVALEEMGAEYKLVSLDLVQEEQKKKPHTDRNPFAQMPALEDGDLILFESRAIARYVARKYRETGPDLLRYGNEKEAAVVEVWLEVESQRYCPVATPIMYNGFLLPAFGMQSSDVENDVEKLSKVLDVYEDRLSQTKYLAGDFFSLADLHHLPHTYYLMSTPHAYLINSRPHVKAWWEDLLSRPACKKVTDDMAATLEAMTGSKAAK